MRRTKNAIASQNVETARDISDTPAAQTISALHKEAETKGVTLAQSLEQLLNINSPAAQTLFAQAAVLAGKPDAPSLAEATQFITALTPRSGMESMLAVQLVGTHCAAVKAMIQAGSTSHSEIAERTMNQATRLMTLFARQAELYARLQGKISQQRITVEHVEQAAIVL